MISYNVCLKSSDRAKELVSIVEKLDYDVDLMDGSIIVDAKSLIGVIAMDLSRTLQLRLHTDKEDADIKERLKDIIV